MNYTYGLCEVGYDWVGVLEVIKLCYLSQSLIGYNEHISVRLVVTDW